MAGTAVTVRGVGRATPDANEIEALRTSLNKVITDLENLRNGVDAVCDILDADAGVTATNTAATFNMATAAALTANTVSVSPG